MTQFHLSLLQSLRARFTAVALSLLLLIFTLFGFVIVNDQEYEVREEAHRDVKKIGLLMQSTINRMLRHGNADFVADALAELHVDQQVNAALVVDRDGVVVYAYRKYLIGRNVDSLMLGIQHELLENAIATRLSQYKYDERERKFIGYIPIVAAEGDVINREMHALVVEFSLGKKWYHAASSRTFEIVSVIVSIIVISSLFWIIFDRGITKRLQVIADAIGLLGHGEAVKTVAVSGGDEIALVARALELMSAERDEYEATLRKLSTAVSQSWDSVVITSLDAEIEYVNEAFTRNTGYSRDEVIGQNPRILQSGLTPSSVYDEMWETLLAGNVWAGKLWNKRKDETEYVEWATITPVKSDDGVITHYIGVKQNITEKLALEHAREEAEAVLDNFFEQSINLNLIAQFDGVIKRVNIGWYTILGYSSDELVGKSLMELVHPEDRGRTQDEVEKLSHGIATPYFQNRYLHRDGTYRLLAWSATASVEDELVYAVAMDITERDRAEKKVHKLAYYDPLTNLPNKTYLLETMDGTINSAVEKGALGVCFVIDIDFFQKINDARGYRFGDEVLKEVADRLGQVVHDDCLIARVGNDVFAGMTPLGIGDRQSALLHANSMSQTILEILRRPMLILGEELSVTVSIGASVFPEPRTSADGILRYAETALHHAKRLGGNQHSCYEQSIGQKVLYTYETEKALHQAILNDELRMYVQPQVTYAGEVRGLEALVRWEHPERGLVMPGAFVPTAEESDLIDELDNFMLSKAVEVIAINDAVGRSVTISVNVSPRHFRKVGFVPWLKETIARVGADANHLVLEVTEGIVIDNISEIVEKMNELRDIGIRFSIDDFGTGYSSLSYLKRLPVSELKIDRAFIKDLPSDKGDADLVNTILSVAASLNLHVVAEGVETQQQADFLNSRMDILYQGYYYGKPVPVDEWLELNS